MSKALPWYKRCPRDWRRGTRDKSCMPMELRGFFSECLDAMWEVQGQIPLCSKHLALALGSNPRQVRSLMPQLVALGEMVRTLTGYYNPRMMADILNVDKKALVMMIDLQSAPSQPPVDLQSRSKVPKNSMITTREVRDRKEDTDIERKEETDRQTRVGPSVDATILKSSFNGMTDLMIEEVLSAMEPLASRQRAVDWLSNLLATNGQDAVGGAFQQLLTKRADNEPVARVLPYLSKTAASLKAKAAAPAEKPKSAFMLAFEQDVANHGVTKQ